jgi:hypothetical protein
MATSAPARRDHAAATGGTGGLDDGERRREQLEHGVGDALGLRAEPPRLPVRARADGVGATLALFVPASGRTFANGTMRAALSTATIAAP